MARRIITTLGGMIKKLNLPETHGLQVLKEFLAAASCKMLEDNSVILKYTDELIRAQESGKNPTKDELDRLAKLSIAFGEKNKAFHYWDEPPLASNTVDLEEYGQRAAIPNYDALEPIVPYIVYVLDGLFKNYTVDDLLEDNFKLWVQTIQQARLFKRLDELSEDTKRKPVTIRKPKYPKDRINAISITESAIWNMTKERLALENNQYIMYENTVYDHGASYLSKAGGTEFTTIAFNFDDAGEDFKGLDYKYRSVHNVVCNFILRGHTRATLYELYSNSELCGDASKTRVTADLKFMLAALQQMDHIKVYVDCTQDYQSYQQKLGNDVFIKSASLLHTNIVYQVGKDTGELKNIIVEFDGEIPPLYRRAFAIGKTYSVPLAAVQTPLPKNDDMLKLQAYMTETVEYMREGDRSDDILIETMLRQLGKTGRRDYKARLLTPPGIKQGKGGKKTKTQGGYLLRLLDYWKSIDYIQDYKIENDRIKIKIKKNG